MVQQTVLQGELPAREVVHATDGSWLVGDGVNDPNPPGASVATHLAHAIALNSSIAGLASMPPGHIARRSGPGGAVDHRRARGLGRRRTAALIPRATPPTPV